MQEMNNQVRVQIIDGPLDKVPQTGRQYESAGAGAVIVFEGLVRPLEGNAVITGLEYKAYEPMASRMLTKIANEITAKYKLTAMTVLHSTGIVGTGECSFRLLAAAEHRAEAIAAVTEFINRMKEDVPIWKTPVLE